MGLAAAALFGGGVTLGALVDARPPAPMLPAPAVRVPAAAYPAEVLHVIDGDTFEARVRIWPGMEAVTRVRLRRVDAPEMKARCEGEYAKAVAARDALARLLETGSVGLTNVGQDRYGGRVDADVSSSSASDVGEALVSLGLARRYGGGRRRGWCG